MVEIHVILGRNAQILWNSQLASLYLVQKILQVWNFVAFLLQKTRQEPLYPFQLMSEFSSIRCTIKVLCCSSVVVKFKSFY